MWWGKPRCVAWKEPIKSANNSAAADLRRAVRPDREHKGRNNNDRRKITGPEEIASSIRSETPVTGLLSKILQEGEKTITIIINRGNQDSIITTAAAIFLRWLTDIFTFGSAMELSVFAVSPFR